MSLVSYGRMTQTERDVHALHTQWVIYWLLIYCLGKKYTLTHTHRRIHLAHTMRHWQSHTHTQSWTRRHCHRQSRDYRQNARQVKRRIWSQSNRQDWTHGCTRGSPWEVEYQEKGWYSTDRALQEWARQNIHSDPKWILMQHYWLSHVYERASWKTTVGGLYEEGLTEHGPGLGEYSQQGPHTGSGRQNVDKGQRWVT